MNILLINAISVKGNDAMIPLGLLYVGGIIQRSGHQAKILDQYLYAKDNNLGYDNFEPILKTIDEYKPLIIGYGGISTSYGSVKKLCRQIKARFPDICQIAGGPLASTYKLLLSNTDIDLVFHGETEISLPIFLSKFENANNYFETPGISYLYKGEITRNDPAMQIKDLDTVPFPPYDLIDIKRYLNNIEDWIVQYSGYMSDNPYHYDSIRKTIGKKKYFMPIISGRGCTNQCLFCYRHVKGIRKHSVDYVINHMKYLMENYGVEGFQFVDELFNPTQKWVDDFCNGMKKAGLDIFYLVAGARVDKIDADILQQLKETGCIGVNYGQESGSDTILKELRKMVTTKLNKEITILTKSMGIITVVQLVIGSPQETNDTIYETIKFLKDVGAYSPSVNYLIPLPETPIWKYIEENHLITELEGYLDLVAEYGGTEPLINLTKFPDHDWRRWSILIKKEIKPDYYKNKSAAYYYYIKLIYALLYKILYFVHPITLKKLIPLRFKKLIGHIP